MLPYLAKKKDGSATGLIVKTRAPDQDPKEDQDDPQIGHITCAHALMDAIKANDAQGVADALYDAFTLMDSQPHDEAEHTEKHSYAAQNERAAKDDE